ncbi:UDP-N-acetylmuramate dehydrogenase [Patescibacteria group bacterium]|nr:UDP-N-acetylmuramate dehydrogenase [Patescibacteria group bacterium]
MVLALPNLQRDMPLAPYTTYKIGGPADYFVIASNRDELANAVLTARKDGMPYFILGTGANILMSDAGFRGLVILNRANQIHWQDTTVEAESGAVMADLIEQTAARGLSGLEHYAGIPSTVGGALWQNLHFLSPDRQSTVYLGDILLSAQVLLPDAGIQTVDREFFRFGYDQSRLRLEKGIVVLAATFALTPKPEDEIRRQIEANLVWRAEKHPDLTRFPSCGSVFKKIEGVGAGRLIEKVGLKGYRIGNAQISEQHANFIVNRGGATAADVLALIELIQKKVKEETGYRLEPEIRLVGENLKEVAE